MESQELFDWKITVVGYARMRMIHEAVEVIAVLSVDRQLLVLPWEEKL